MQFLTNENKDSNYKKEKWRVDKERWLSFRLPNPTYREEKHMTKYNSY